MPSWEVRQAFLFGVWMFCTPTWERQPFQAGPQSFMLISNPLGSKLPGVGRGVLVDGRAREF